MLETLNCVAERYILDDFSFELNSCILFQPREVVKFPTHIDTLLAPSM
jgi:hypothetical protein